MKSKLANLIKNKRKILGLTQQALASGICTQTVVSKIEKEELTPSVDIFFKLIKKLDITIEEIADLYEINSKKKNSLYSEEVIKLIYRREYKTIEYILKNTDKNTLGEEDSYYYDFLNALISYNLEKNADKTFEILNNIIENTGENSNIHLKALYSLGTFLNDIEEHDKSKFYLEKIIPKMHLFSYKEDRWIFLYALSRMYMNTDNLVESNKYISTLLNELQGENSTFLLGYAYFMRYHIFKKQDLNFNALDSINTAIKIFEVENNDFVKNLALQCLSNIKEKIKNEKEI